MVALFEQYENAFNKLLNKVDCRFYTTKLQFMSAVLFVEEDLIQYYEFTLRSDNGKDIIASFTLKQLPGCCGIALTCYSIVYFPNRGKGVGTLLNAFKQDIARALGYSVLLLTDRENNPAQRKILEKYKWMDIHQFTNARTNNKVNISIINL